MSRVGKVVSTLKGINSQQSVVGTLKGIYSQKSVVSGLVCLFLVALFSFASAQEVQLEREVFEISRGLRCPTCVSESVADSHAEVSVQMRQIVRELLQEGRSREEVYAYFVERYGDWILMNPPRRGVHLIVWILPVVGGLLGATALVYYLRRWTERGETPIDADPEYLARVRKELEKDS
jgi:cytochrome c-type biogenesis protein CcmH